MIGDVRSEATRFVAEPGLDTPFEIGLRLVDVHSLARGVVPAWLQAYARIKALRWAQDQQRAVARPVSSPRYGPDVFQGASGRGAGRGRGAAHAGDDGEDVTGPGGATVTASAGDGGAGVCPGGAHTAETGAAPSDGRCRECRLRDATPGRADGLCSECAAAIEAAAR